MNKEQQEPLELARRVGFVGTGRKMISEKLLLKLNAGVKEFDTILRNPHKIGKIFTLGRGKLGSVSESLLKRSNLFIPTKPVTAEIINKLSQIHRLSNNSENRLYHLIVKGILPTLSKNDPSVEERRLADCIVIEEEKKKAYFAKDQIGLERMISKLGRVLYYKAKLPSRLSTREERMYYMRDRIDAFSQEVRSLSK